MSGELSRRRLLQRALVGGSALALGTRASFGASASADTAAVMLDGRDADVWSWNATVTGTNRTAGELELLVDDRVVRDAKAHGPFAIRLPVAPGENVVQAQAGGHASRRLRLRGCLPDRPRALISARHREGLVLDGSPSTASPWSNAEIVRWQWSWPKGVDARLTGPRHDQLTISSISSSESSVTLHVTDREGRRDAATVRLIGGAEPAVAPAASSAEWIDDAVIYGVVPPLFGDHPLAAVTGALPRLAELGVNTLWLSPITDAVPGDFGYEITDLLSVRPDYGTDADLTALVQHAHALGLRVLLDLVVNDTSDRHPYFQAAQRGGPLTHQWTFYDRDRDGEPTHYFDWVHLPNLDYDNPEVRLWIIEVSKYWIEKFDIDGYRIDAAWAIRQRRPSFFSEWRAELHRVKPSVLLLGEATADDPWYLDGRFDAAYDWGQQIGHWSWEGVFDESGEIVTRLERLLVHPDGSITGSRTFRFLNNNDTGTRFATRYGSNLTRAAAALLLTLPGLPCIYTGDEIGADFDPYGVLTPLPNGDPHHLRPWYRRLLEIRSDRPALRGAGAQQLRLPAPAARSVLAYERRASDDRVIVAINFSDQHQTISAGSRQLIDLVTDEPFVGTSVPIPPWDARILAFT